MLRGPTRVAFVAGISLLSPGASLALETDQFYAWNRELPDSTAALNARVNADLEDVLAEVARADGTPACAEVRQRIAAKFRFLIFGPVEVWASQTSLVDRIPATPEEELGYRRASIYRRMSPIDPAGWLPLTVTISLAGVRVGTDKLTHFFNEGHYYFRWYDGARRPGRQHDPAAIDRAIRLGILSERTLLGKAASGVFSAADLEANYQGLLFFLSLCEGESPRLETLPGGGFRLARPFDWHEFVTPEWDESWQPGIYTGRRWREVAPEMRRHCAQLDDPQVIAVREAYRARDRLTPTEERMIVLVREGKIPDPATFSIERVCGAYRFPSDAPAGSGLESPFRGDRDTEIRDLTPSPTCGIMSGP